jgi:hypothetical protein
MKDSSAQGSLLGPICYSLGMCLFIYLLKILGLHDGSTYLPTKPFGHICNRPHRDIIFVFVCIAYIVMSECLY